jgi:hypothetical protein
MTLGSPFMTALLPRKPNFPDYNNSKQENRFPVQSKNAVVLRKSGCRLTAARRNGHYVDRLLGTQSGGFHRMLDRMSVLLIRMGDVHRAGATDRTTELRATQRIVNDLTNGAGAASTLGAAAEATINMRRGAARCFFDSGAHFAISQDVARTDNHGSAKM